MSDNNKNRSIFVVVTGAAGGLGLAVCRELSACGYTVAACDLRPLPEVLDNVASIEVDLTDNDSVDACADRIRSMTDRVFAIVNLAGIFCMSSVSESPADALERSLAVNVLGMYRINRALLPLLVPKYSRIINMSSEMGRYSPPPFVGPYAISKHAADTYTDVLRRELMFTGIPVCKVQAGSFATAMLDAAQQQFDTMVQNTERFEHQLTTLAPIMLSELSKGTPPELFARMIARELRRRKPRRCVRIRNSFKLSLLDALPEGMQDICYRIAMVVFSLFGRKD